MFNVSKNLRVLRKSKRMTISELAEMSGVSVSYLSQLERGKKDDPSAKVVYRVARALDKDMWEVLGVLESSHKVEVPK